jgi:hypothetical protein
VTLEAHGTLVLIALQSIFVTLEFHGTLVLIAFANQIILKMSNNDGPVGRPE